MPYWLELCICFFFSWLSVGTPAHTYLFFMFHGMYFWCILREDMLIVTVGFYSSHLQPWLLVSLIYLLPNTWLAMVYDFFRRSYELNNWARMFYVEIKNMEEFIWACMVLFPVCCMQLFNLILKHKCFAAQMILTFCSLFFCWTFILEEYRSHMVNVQWMNINFLRMLFILNFQHEVGE